MMQLTADITIGQYGFTQVNEVKIKKSMHTLGSEATIKIPATAYLKSEGEKATALETAKQFKTGDFVTINLGYDGENNEEFFGFVKRINFTNPVEIECEDWTWMLKKRNYVKSWQSTSLREVLNYLIAGLGVTLNANIPDITLTNFQIKTNGADALQKIKDEYGLTIYFFSGELYAGLAYTITRGLVKYALNGAMMNLINANDLKYRNKDDVQLTVKAICIKKDNTKIEAEIGDPDGEKRTLFFYDIESKAQLEKLAQQEIEKYKYDGYEGKITSFIKPFADVGYHADIDDPIYPERSGTYYVEQVEVTYGTSGARRVVHVGIKI